MQSSSKRPITRNRELVACTECRRRKLKCDRNVPCAACVRRNDDASCVYQRFAKGPDSERQRRVQAEARLEHLEGLVQQLAKSGTTSDGSHTNTANYVSQQSSSPEFSDGVNSSESIPTISTSQSYSGETHWSAMLDDIQELRSAIAPLDDNIANEPNGQDENAGDFALILGAAGPLSYSETIDRFLPEKEDAARLVSAYLRSSTVAAPFIHASHFQRRYQKFWEDPYSAPPLWSSIFFSICYISTVSLSPSRHDETKARRYSMAAAHCLATGGYYRPQRFAVEALLLFAQSKCFTGLSVTHEVGVVFGLLIRLATKMGYHRDPAMLNLSPFDGEMRRRTWSMCLQLDLLISFQLGLPSNIQYPTWDTQPPQSLFDSDFDEDTVQMPPARPDTECTNMLFYIAKHRLMTVFEKVLRHTLSTESPSNSGPKLLDSEIREVYSGVPAVLHPRSMVESVGDSASMIVTRMCVNLVYYKALCVLHRRYAAQGCIESILACETAASELVRSIVDSFKEFQVGGQFEAERWFMSALTWHDFLLGVIALCLVLCVTSQYDLQASVNVPEVTSLLQKAHALCIEQAGRSGDTKRVERLVRETLSWVEKQDNREKAHRSIDVLSPELSSGMHIDGIGHANGAITDYSGSLQGLQNGNDLSIAEDWSLMDGSVAPIDDISWTYLEQFLNLPSDDLMG